MNRSFDPIILEPVKNELAAVSEEIAIAVSKAARSPMVRVGDFAATVADRHGRLIGPGYASPLQLGNFIELMPHVLDKYDVEDMRAGDVFVTNDPFGGMGHLPDTAVVMPIEWHNAIAGFCVAYSHHTDVGGRFAGGSSSMCSEAYEEGLRLPCVKVYDRASGMKPFSRRFRETFVREEWLGDLEAKVSGCWRGARGLQLVLDKYGAEVFDESCDLLIDHAEKQLRNAIRSIPDGDYGYEAIFEDDGFGNPVALPIKATIKIRDDTICFDFTGTAEQVASALNNPESLTKATCYGATKLLVGPDVPVNTGFVRPISVEVPPGSLLNPRFPAAVGGRGPIMMRTLDVLFRALAQAQPEQVPVLGEAGDVLYWSGIGADGRSITAMDMYFGGWGGRPSADGIDGVAPITFGSYGAIPTEFIERDYPLMISRFELVPDSEGPGRYRGSLGVAREWKFLQPGHAMVRTCRLNRSTGLHGGESGSLSVNRLTTSSGSSGDTDRVTHLHLEVEPGDEVFHAICGSGGYGDPWTRDPGAVAVDVRAEKVSVERARECYGVVIEEKSSDVDLEATSELRARRTDT